MVELSDVLSFQSEDEEKKNEAVRELFKFDDHEIDIKTKTDLSNDDIKQLTRLKLIAQRFDIPIIDSLCDTFCLFRISTNRLGRNEIIETIQPREKENVDTRSLFRKIFNK